MAVYTSITDKEFTGILKTYPIGDFVSAHGVKAGIENTNYFLTTTTGNYVFTLFEKVNKDELALYVSLLQNLFLNGIACPNALLNNDKQPINEINDKPYILVPRFKGQNLTSINKSNCKIIATTLAKIHSATIPSVLVNKLTNRRDKRWREITAEKVTHKLPIKEARLLNSELESYSLIEGNNLPRGIIHADLFPDNALFLNGQLTGIIDFYDACYETFLYDIAITVNAWCTNEHGELIKSNVSGFLHCYQLIRSFTEEEKYLWPVMLRIAAMRFWLSRLESLLTPLQGELTHHKNPNDYLKILQNHINSNGHYSEWPRLTCR